MTAPSLHRGRYRAFISYSHADEGAAAWLHRALERFEIPKDVRGDAQSRFAPVFRDEEELAASDDLSEGIRAALRDSDNLVVLCSPDAARSRWVDEEVRYFKDELGRRRVFACIVDGEPPDCFPPALRGLDREPLAADARPGRDRDTAKEKLVAGMLGIPFDELRDREARRRQRRLTMLVGVSTAASLVMGTLLVFALLARTEATRERQAADVARESAEREAETAREVADFAVGLFELADPGTASGSELAAHELVDRGARLLETRVGNDPRVKARLQSTLGNVYRGLGRYTASESQLRAALDARTASGQPVDSETIAIQLDLAAVLVARGAYAEAEGVARAALAEAETRRDPLAHRARREIGAALRLQGRHADARGMLESALAHEDAMPVERAEQQVALAAVLHVTGEDPTARVHLDEALLTLEAELGPNHPVVLSTLRTYADVLRYLGEDPMPVWQRVVTIEQRIYGPDHPSLAESYDNMAIALFVTDKDAAQRSFQKALAIRERALEPGHTDIGISHNNLGYFAFTQQDWATARRHLTLALEIQTAALGVDHHEVARIMTNLGSVQAQLAELDEAEELLKKGLDVRRARLGPEHIDVAHSLIELGKVNALRNDRKGAAAAYDEAEKIVAAYEAKGVAVAYVRDDLEASRARLAQ